MKSKFLAFPIIGILLLLTLTTPVQYYSSELTTRATTSSSSTRTDFIRNNTITFAADKGYATVIKTPTLEEYFDEYGRAVTLPAGYSKIKKELGLITYLDESGAPVVINNGYDSIHRTYTEDGQADTDTYYIGETQVERKGGYWGYRRVYEDGKVAEIQYLDQDGELVLNSSGYAVIKRSYTETGRTDMYFGINGEPVGGTLGQYGVYKELDDEGRTIQTTYLDAQGHPLNTTRGYATIKTSYEKGLTRQYYDAEGKPVTVGSSQYGTQRVNGQKIYLDEDGEPVFRLDNFLHRHLVLVAVFGLVLSFVAVMLRGRGRTGFIVLYIAFIAFMTLYYRDARDSRGQFELFWSYRQFFSSIPLRGEILKNIWLFVPLGAALVRVRNGWLWAIGLSVVIEIVQYVTGLGLAEFDDVISNGLGAAVGFGFGYVLEPVVKRFKRTRKKRTDEGTMREMRERNRV